MTARDPHLEFASDAIRRLRNEASDAEWAGRSDAAAALRAEADRIARSGERYVPLF